MMRRWSAVACVLGLSAAPAVAAPRHLVDLMDRSVKWYEKWFGGSTPLGSSDRRR